MKWALDMMSDDAGNLSSVRAVMMLSFALILAGWLVVSIQHSELQNLPESVLWVLGATLGGKVAQKFTESKTPATPSAPAAPEAVQK